MWSQIIVSTVVGQSLSSMWVMINTLQIIYYSAMMTPYFPKIVLSLFSYLEVANLENDAFSKIYKYHFDTTLVENRTSWDYSYNVHRQNM
mmetsp:Transcript_28065/g.24795  ORF Transcript_28065/g.24795 Transcript_28065/m.24795 type:complete len:90 (-) Transcript_28065:356-625(-)